MRNKNKMKNNYLKLLKHPKWYERRLEILKRDNQQCVICKSKNKLEIHHKQYHFSKSNNSFVPPWQYEDKYLATICSLCHKMGHNLIVKIPIFKIK
jgi:5-methylcytosine-specific restriction endonuclease McrA